MTDGAEPFAGGAGRPDPRRAGARFWVTAAAGWVVIAVGVRGALEHDIDTRPGELARFVVGGALVHDLAFAPVVLVAGSLVARLVRSPWRAPVQVGAVISASVTLFAYPLVRAFGLAADNPTSLPHNYTVNLALVLAAVWLATAATALLIGVRRARGRVRSPTQQADAPAAGSPPSA